MAELLLPSPSRSGSPTSTHTLSAKAIRVMPYTRPLRSKRSNRRTHATSARPNTKGVALTRKASPTPFAPVLSTTRTIRPKALTAIKETKARMRRACAVRARHDAKAPSSFRSWKPSSAYSRGSRTHLPDASMASMAKSKSSRWRAQHRARAMVGGPPSRTRVNPWTPRALPLCSLAVSSSD